MQSTESTCSELCTDLARKDALYRAPEGFLLYSVKIADSHTHIAVSAEHCVCALRVSHIARFLHSWR